MNLQSGLKPFAVSRTHSFAALPGPPMLDTMPDARSGAMPETPRDAGPGAPAQTRNRTPDQTRSYDVCFFVSRRRALHFLDRGITLDADGLSCTADGSPGTELFANITAVHLQTSG